MLGAVDIVNVNLSQKDLRSLISVWQDNISKISLLKKIAESEDRVLPQGSRRDVKHDDDVMVKKLEDFLTRNERTLCEVSVKLTFEGLQLNLFMDTEEASIIKLIFTQIPIAILMKLHVTCAGTELSRARSESRAVQAELRGDREHLGLLQRQELEDEAVRTKLPLARHSQGFRCREKARIPSRVYGSKRR